jgi:hypothetical protein
MKFSVQLTLLFLCALCSAPALAAEKYQTNIGPTPLDGSNGTVVTGRGSVQARLNGRVFTLRGRFTGLASPATTAHLCLGDVMGGVGPAVHEVTASQAQSGEISGTVTLTPQQVDALRAGRIYLLLDSQKAPQGNLWGWFQPAHVTVGPDVPQRGPWYLPTILKDPKPAVRKKAEG